MDTIVEQWNEIGVLEELLQHKLVFIETQDVVETSLALDNFRRACDCGRGAVFFSVARGKVLSLALTLTLTLTLTQTTKNSVDKPNTESLKAAC